MRTRRANLLKRPPAWTIAVSITVASGVGFSVLLIGASQGVQSDIYNRLAADSTFARVVPVETIDHTLNLLTYVVIAAMLLQTAFAIYVLGVTTMRSRRQEIALRRQSGVLRSRLLKEFARGMLGACLIGGVFGKVAGVATAAFLQGTLGLPVSFEPPIALVAPFPLTVILALVATLGPAWRSAGASPALLRRE